MSSFQSIQFPKYFSNFITIRNGNIFIKRSRYKIIYGGRGGAKTVSFTLLMLLIVLREEKHCVVARESKEAVIDTVYKTFLHEIDRYNLGIYFTITSGRIVSKPTGASIHFLGLFNRFEKVKGMNHISIFWVDEANTLSERAMKILLPSIREKDSEIWFTFNPENEDDPVYLNFIKNPPINGAIIVKANWRNNEFHNDIMELERLNSLAKDPLLYEHVWEGALLQGSEDSYWRISDIEKMQFNEEIVFDRIVIGVDPAMTHKDTSNEFGIVVVGVNEDNYYILADYSGNFPPSSFARTVGDAYKRHKACSIVVETNAGGDFIKSALLAENPYMVVEEVRARQAKSLRALPVLQLSLQGRLFISSKFEFRRLKSQMMRMTTRGFQGKAGESPDRLEAMIWAVYHLAGLSDGDTIETVFNRSMLREYHDDVEGREIAFLYCSVDMFSYVRTIFCNKTKRIYIKDVKKGNVNVLNEFLERNQIPTKIISNQEGIVIYNSMRKLYSFMRLLGTYYFANSRIESKILATLHTFQNNSILIQKEVFATVFNELKRYTTTSTEAFLLLEVITVTIAYYFRIESVD